MFPPVESRGRRFASSDRWSATRSGRPEAISADGDAPLELQDLEEAVSVSVFTIACVRILVGSAKAVRSFLVRNGETSV